jgi:PAS domain-containing protein
MATSPSSAIGSGVSSVAGHGSREHVAHFYEDDRALAESLADFMGESLAAEGAAVFIGVEPHRNGVAERLGRRGFDLPGLQAEGRYVPLDAGLTLAKFLVDGWPDAARFRTTVGGILEKASAASRGAARVRAVGEMVAVLWREGRRDAAMQLERLWNELLEQHPLALLCAYPLKGFPASADGGPLLEVCAEHSHHVPAEAWSGLAHAGDRNRLILELQQRSLALDTEIARRKDLEHALRRREKELADVLDNAGLGVIDVEPDGRIRWVNRPLAESFGFGESELVGRPVSDVMKTPGLFDEVWNGLAIGKPPRDLAVEIAGRGYAEQATLKCSVLRLEGKAVHMRWFVRLGHGPA